MIYLFNNAYYIKRFSKLIKIIPSFNKNGDVILTPTDEKILVDDASDYKLVDLAYIAKELKNAENKIENEDVKDYKKSEAKKTSYNSKYKKFN